MKKILLLAVAIIGFASVASARTTFEAGTQNITVTTGFSSGYRVPINISYERGIINFAADHKLGLGAYAAFGNANFFAAAECNYHFVGVESLDVYGGARVGYRVETSDDNDGGLYKSFDVGINYYLFRNLAINAELGTGMESICVGLTYRF